MIFTLRNYNNGEVVCRLTIEEAKDILNGVWQGIPWNTIKNKLQYISIFTGERDYLVASLNNEDIPLTQDGLMIR